MNHLLIAMLLSQYFKTQPAPSTVIMQADGDAGVIGACYQYHSGCSTIQVCPPSPPIAIATTCPTTVTYVIPSGATCTFQDGGLCFSGAAAVSDPETPPKKRKHK